MSESPMNTLDRRIVGVAFFVLVLVGSLRGFAAATEDLLAGPPAGPWRRLFLDAMVVEKQHGLERTFHVAQKYSGNPVIRADKPWEISRYYGGPYLYGTVMWDEGKLRMWYHVHQGGYMNCYAESTDGIHWTKPNLGLVEFKGSKANNIFLWRCTDSNEHPPYASSGRCHNPSVIKRPWVADPATRYALFCYGVDYRHARVAFSPDGLHWTFAPQTAEKGLFRSADVLNFFYDPYKARYVATWKTGSRRGRAVGVVVSKDGLTWTKPVVGPVFVADDLDPDATQIYGMPVFPYQGLYIGLAWIYNARWFKYGSYTDKRMYEVEKDSPCTVDVQLAWSWDLINWTRPPRRHPFIPRGKSGEFDSGMIYTARAPVVVNDKLYFYYGGWDGTHNSPKSKANIGLATLRLDGFCSMRAGAKEGWLISRRERFRIPKVTINARTWDDGYVAAELLDTNNQPVPGFTRKECIPFRGDSFRHVLTWKAEALPDAMVGVDKKIRFYLKNAELYSYLPDQTTGPVTIIYDPMSNGGRLPDDPSIPEEQRFALSGWRGGFRIVRERGVTYLDMHSIAERKTNACAFKDLDWNDDTDWCMEAWYRVADKGTEPNYGLATFVRPNAGRNVALYLSDKAVGLNSTKDGRHITLKTVPMDTTGAFHWYRLVHRGGAHGEVVLFVDGKEVLRLPFERLFPARVRGHNLLFGPNAAQREGRLHVAKFGFRTGSTDVMFGPALPVVSPETTEGQRPRKSQP